MVSFSPCHRGIFCSYLLEGYQEFATQNFKTWFFRIVKVLYSTLLQLPSLRFNCVGGAGIKSWTVVTLALAVKSSYQCV